VQKITHEIKEVDIKKIVEVDRTIQPQEEADTKKQIRKKNLKMTITEEINIKKLTLKITNKKKTIVRIETIEEDEEERDKISS